MQELCEVGQYQWHFSNEYYAPKHGIVHLDEIYSCLELSSEGYNLFGHAMYESSYSQIYVPSKRGHRFLVNTAKKHAFSRFLAAFSYIGFLWQVAG